jgi:hypothetical protein
VKLVVDHRRCPFLLRSLAGVAGCLQENKKTPRGTREVCASAPGQQLVFAGRD